MSLFIKLHTEVLTDDKLIEVGPDAAWMWVRGLLWSKDHATEGVVTKAAIAIIGAGIKNPKSCETKLLSAGLWVKEGSGYSLGTDSRGTSKWAKYQITNDDIEQKREVWAAQKRAQREKEKGEMSTRTSADMSMDSPPDMSDGQTETCPPDMSTLSANCPRANRGRETPDTRHQTPDIQQAATKTQGSSKKPRGPNDLAACRLHFEITGSTSAMADRFWEEFSPGWRTNSGDLIVNWKAFSKTWLIQQQSIPKPEPNGHAPGFIHPHKLREDLAH